MGVIPDCAKTLGWVVGMTNIDGVNFHSVRVLENFKSTRQTSLSAVTDYRYLNFATALLCLLITFTLQMVLDLDSLHALFAGTLGMNHSHRLPDYCVLSTSDVRDRYTNRNCRWKTTLKRTDWLRPPHGTGFAAVSGLVVEAGVVFVIVVDERWGQLFDLLLVVSALNIELGKLNGL